MRSSPLPLIALVLLALAGTAAGQAFTEIELGDRLTGTVPDEDPVVVPFLGLAQSSVTMTLTADPGSFPDLRILRPDRSELDLAGVKKADRKGRKMKVKKLVLPVTGRYFLLVTTRTPSDFALKTAAKPRKKVSETVAVATTGIDYPFPAPPGTLLSIRLKAPKLSILRPEIEGITDPRGEAVDLSGAKRKTKGNQDSLSRVPLGTTGLNEGFGDYVIHLGIQEGEDAVGDVGQLRIKAKLPKPRKARLDAADLRVDPFVDAVSLRSAFDNQAFPGVEVTGDFFKKGVALALVGYDPATGAPTGETISPNLGEPATTRPTPSRIVAGFDFQDLPVGFYDVVVTNPDGTTAKLTAPDDDGDGEPDPSFRLLRAPRATGIAPRLVFDGPLYNDWPMTVNGNSFQHPGVKLTFLPLVEGGLKPPEVAGGGAGVEGTATRLTFGINAWEKDLGFFDVLVENPDGGAITTAETQALRFEIARGPRVTSIDVRSAFDNERKTGITLTGKYLLKTSSGQPEVELVHVADDTEVIPATSETWLSSTRLTFDLDLDGRKGGDYFLRLTNPRRTPEDPARGVDVLADAFTVMVAPTVDSADPDRAFEGETVSTFRISGDHFATGATVRLLQGATVLTPASVVVADAQTITAELDLSGASSGAWSVEVTNPDGGRRVGEDLFHVLGAVGVVENSDGAREPAVAYDSERDEYLVVYTRVLGSDTDIRARRLDASTGGLAGSEIEVTKTTTTKEDQPQVVYDPDGDRYLVVYRAGGTEIAAREVSPDGSLPGSAMSLAKDSDTRAWPRVDYNGEQREFLVVYERFTKPGEDDPENWDVDVIRLPANGAIDPDHLQSFSVAATLDDEREPDVKYEDFWDAWIITWAQDERPPEGGEGPPDTKFDIFVGQLPVFDTQFRAGTAIGVAQTSADERRPRLAHVPGDISDLPELLVVWEQRGANTDLLARRYSPTLDGSMVAAAARVEETASDDASHAELLWDDASSVYRIVYTIGGERVVVTRMSETQGSVAHETVAAGDAGDTYDQPAIAARGSGGEHLAVFRVVDSDVADRDLQAHFKR